MLEGANSVWRGLVARVVSIITATPRNEQAATAIQTQTWRSPDIFSRLCNFELMESDHVDDTAG
jgi:hypothetical protein